VYPGFGGGIALVKEVPGRVPEIFQDVNKVDQDRDLELVLLGLFLDPVDLVVVSVLCPPRVNADPACCERPSCPLNAKSLVPSGQYDRSRYGRTKRRRTSRLRSLVFCRDRDIACLIRNDWPYSQVSRCSPLARGSPSPVT